MNKKTGIFYKDRYELLKREHDKALIELMELKKKYNSLLENYNKNIQDLEYEIREKHKIIGKYNSLLTTSESNE
jgi:ElaB/YqjD/DUF883 family membrane-anchored ribosome-binding protein